MLNEQTIEKLMDMQLREMAKAFRDQRQDSALQAMSFEDRFGLLVDAQWSQRKSKRIENLMRKATFKFPHACMEDMDFSPERLLNRDMILELSQCKYVRDKRNVLIMGAAGAGKTFLSNALGTSACRQLYKVKYIRLPELLVDMSIARGDGSYKILVGNYKKVQLLILDEWMHQPVTESQAGDVFEIIESRYQDSSTVFVAQSEPAGWHRQIGSGVIADAIVDRIVYNSYEITMNGEVNMREKTGLKIIRL
jgi:DNA replication protein DnaC